MLPISIAPKYTIPSQFHRLKMAFLRPDPEARNGVANGDFSNVRLLHTFSERRAEERRAIRQSLAVGAVALLLMIGGVWTLGLILPHPTLVAEAVVP